MREETSPSLWWTNQKHKHIMKPNTEATKMSLRDQIRGNTLGQKKNFKTVPATVNGSEVELRQPTIKERSALRKRCMSVDEEGKPDLDVFEFLIWAVIGYTYVPGTDEKVFSEEDYEALIELPAGGWFDELSEKAADLTNVDAKKSDKDSSKT